MTLTGVPTNSENPEATSCTAHRRSLRLQDAGAVQKIGGSPLLHVAWQGGGVRGVLQAALDLVVLLHGSQLHDLPHSGLLPWIATL